MKNLLFFGLLLVSANAFAFGRARTTAYQCTNKDDPSAATFILQADSDHHVVNCNVKDGHNEEDYPIVAPSAEMDQAVSDFLKEQGLASLSIERYYAKLPEAQYGPNAMIAVLVNQSDLGNSLLVGRELLHLKCERGI